MSKCDTKYCAHTLLMFRSQRLLYCQSQLQGWDQIFSDANPGGSTGWRKPRWSVWVKSVACNFYVFKACLRFLLLFGGFLWWCFHNDTDPWGKLPPDKPLYMVLSSVFSCSLFHGAVKSPYLPTNNEGNKTTLNTWFFPIVHCLNFLTLYSARLCEFSETPLLLCCLYHYLDNVMERS